MASITALVRRFRRSDDGAELIEMALITPVLLLILAGIFDFGFLFRSWEAVTNAAREGARLAVLGLYDETDVQFRVEQFLEDAGLDKTAATIEVVDPVGVDVGGGAGPCITMTGVTVSYPHEYMLVGGIISFFGGNSLTATSLNARSMMRSEGAGVACVAP